MRERVTRPVEYWQHLECDVAAKVGAVMSAADEERRPVIAYLRDLEATARMECHRRETIQVIASGRRLLGDRSNVGPADGPFARSLGIEP